MTWMIYGANGYTGRLVADLAVQRGQKPVLAGRDDRRLAELADALGLERFVEIEEDIGRLSASNPHELMRAMEVQHILDCAKLAAHASLFRTESRWGLYHYRVDYPERDDAEWFVHCHTRKGAGGVMESTTST